MTKETPQNGSNATDTEPKPLTCFVVSEFGAEAETILERGQVLKHLIKKVLVPMGYEVQRADEIDELGQITHQIIDRLVEADLVVADLTGLNPNVFYELAVRHAARKPVITLMTEGTEIPFDLKDVRTVFYDLHDPDKLEAAQNELRLKAEALETDPDKIRNPITVATKFALLQHSPNPEDRVAGALLSAFSELKSEVQSLARKVNEPVVKKLDPAKSNRIKVLQAKMRLLDERIVNSLDGGQVLSNVELAKQLNASLGMIDARLARLCEQGKVYETENGWSNGPF